MTHCITLQKYQPMHWPDQSTQMEQWMVQENNLVKIYKNNKYEKSGSKFKKIRCKVIRIVPTIP